MPDRYHFNETTGRDVTVMDTSPLLSYAFSNHIPVVSSGDAYVARYNGVAGPGEGKHYKANRLGMAKAKAKRRANNKAARKTRRNKFKG